MPHKYYIVLMPSWTEIHPGTRSLHIGQQPQCWPLIGCMCHSHSTDHPHGAFLTVLHRLYITLGPTRRMGRFHSGCTRSGDLWASVNISHDKIARRKVGRGEKNGEQETTSAPELVRSSSGPGCDFYFTKKLLKPPSPRARLHPAVTDPG